jgi:aspartate/methionine/tyrosine aminotransferase
VPVGPEHDFQLTADLVRQYWRRTEDGQPLTVAALVASPANPTGAALSQEALASLLAAVDQQGGQLVVDEIYHGLDFRPAGTERAVTSIVELTDQAFVINSFSKYFGMTGWRLGWLVAPEWALPGLEKLAQNLFISMSTMAQHAALQCFTPATRQLLDARRDEFQRRCDLLLPALEAMGFIIPHYPEGGLYIYADISGFNGRFGADSQAFCHCLLEEHGIALTPGADFGDYRSETMVRFAFTTSIERITFAIEKMQRIFMV